MRPLRARKPDPSPSRWAYRMNRLWLTPAFHRVLRLGLPLAALLGAGFWYLGDGARLRALGEMAYEARRSFEERPEFMVSVLAIDGASSDLAEAVRAVLPVNLPVSSFHLDLDALKEEVETLDAVASARLRVRAGGFLNVEIEERVPAVLWRQSEALVLLDATGHLVAEASERAGFPELPVVAGEGADAAIPEALKLIEAAEPLAERLRGLERIGARRWDLVLDRNQRILLPEDNSLQMLDRLIALHQARDILERDVAWVDLRNPHRPTLRLNDQAMTELIRIRNLEAQGSPE